MFAAGVAEGLTQSDAYRRAYPNSKNWKNATVWKRSSELAGSGEVSGRIAELAALAAKASEVTIERIAQELARLALVDIRCLVRDDGTPKGLHEIDEDTARAIAGLDVVNVGNAEMDAGQVLKFKLADKGANLERLAKLLGYFERDNRQRNPLGEFSAESFFRSIFNKPQGDA